MLKTVGLFKRFVVTSSSCPALVRALMVWCVLGGGVSGVSWAQDPCTTPASDKQGAASTAATTATSAVDAPELASGFRLRMQPVRAKGYMVVTANPLASEVGCRVLQSGGNALDAAVAVQMVLGLVEPQSSGLGGGAFLLHYHAPSGALRSYDGRETAPLAARPEDLTMSSTERQTLRAAFNELRSRGSSVGVPGVLRMLEMAHRAHGHMPWASLMQPAQAIAEQGFVVSPRLAQAIAQAQSTLQRDPDAATYFFNADGSPKTVGQRLRNPDYAQTLKAVANGGADAFYGGDIAQAIMAKVRAAQGSRGGAMSLADLANYKALVREPVCAPYRVYVVCSMGPPSSGALVISQALGMLAHTDLSALRPTPGPEGGVPDARAVHLISEALRLAYADRNAYVADPDFVPLPGLGVASLLNPAYLAQRSQLIDPARSMGTAKPGNWGAATPSVTEGKGTTHVSVADAQGNVVVLTSSIESSLGSFRWVKGFLLNNQLTDFAWFTEGAQPANRLQGGKRPRSSMSPTLVFKRQADGSRGEVVMATGSPGGPAIMPYVLKTLVAVLDWGLDAQAAASLMNFGAYNTPVTFIEAEHPAWWAPTNMGGGASVVLDALQARGHLINPAAQTSGVGVMVREGAQWVGGADPRREGIALGGP